MRRREFLRGSLGAGALLLLDLEGLGCGNGASAIDGGNGIDGGCADPFAGGTRLGAVPIVGEGTAPLDVPFGADLDGRLYHDLSTLDSTSLITPNDQFYIRTRYPDLLDPNQPWSVQLHGLVNEPMTLSLTDLAPLVTDQGVHLMECSGNGPFAHFGMLSAARWSGARLSDVIAMAQPQSQATRVLVSGFDMYSMPSVNSVPGASWIFSFDEISRAGAFLATEMNGVPLPKDHGYPLRLLVPNWYGCTCIKWVNEIALVDETAPATSQMQEYAARTMQNGVPTLAKDYVPASIDVAAMPVRVEQWMVGGRVSYRVVGVLWGGDRPTGQLQIRFNPNDAWTDVDVCPAPSNEQTWTLWSHQFNPGSIGNYAISLHVAETALVKGIRQRRLDEGYYVRTVMIDQV